MASTTPSNTMILRCKEVVARLKLSRATVYDKLNPKSPRYDHRFPKPIRLGTKAVGWFEHELDAWLLSRQCSRTNLMFEERNEVIK